MEKAGRPVERALRIGGWLPQPRHAARRQEDAEGPHVRSATADGRRGAAAGVWTSGYRSEPTELDADELRLDRPDTHDRPALAWYRRRTLLTTFVSVLIVAVAAVGAVRTLGATGDPERPDRGVALSPSRAFLPVPEPPATGSPIGGQSATTSSPAIGSPSDDRRNSPGASPGTSATPGTPSRTGGAGQPTAPGPTTRPPSTTAPPPVISYEAEAGGNVLGGGARTSSLPVASGGRIVSYVGSLRFTGVTVATRGHYSLVISYVCGDRRFAYLKVNGRSADSVTFPSTGGSGTVGSLTVRIELQAGANTVEFSNLYGWGPGFDRITIR